MKSKEGRKKIIIAALSLLLVVICIVGLAGSRDKGLSYYKGLSEEEFSKKMSKMSVTEIFKDINMLSEEGLEYMGLMLFAVELYEKGDELTEELLMKNILRKQNHDNLRMLCLDLLDSKFENEYGDTILSNENVEKLKALVLEEDESSGVRSFIVGILPPTDNTVKILKILAASEDEYVAIQASKQLNYLEQRLMFE